MPTSSISHYLSVAGGILPPPTAQPISTSHPNASPVGMAGFQTLPPELMQIVVRNVSFLFLNACPGNTDSIDTYRCRSEECLPRQQNLSRSHVAHTLVLVLLKTGSKWATETTRHTQSGEQHHKKCSEVYFLAEGETQAPQNDGQRSPEQLVAVPNRFA